MSNFDCFSLVYKAKWWTGGGHFLGFLVDVLVTFIVNIKKPSARDICFFKNQICEIIYMLKTNMPRKRRKAINTETTPDIPFQKVRVEWVDCVSDSGWATDKEFDKMKLATPVNEGWLYEKTKDHIKMFASYDKDEDGITFGDRTMIPRQWVKKIQKLG